MSIQQTIRNNRKSRLLKKFQFYENILKLKFTFEKLVRHINSTNEGVFYNYKYEYPDLHPTFKRFNDYSPLNYENLSKAKLYHWVHHPNFDDGKPFIIEPVDHPLSPTVKPEPEDNISMISEVADIYLNKRCKKIIVESIGQLDLFKYYFGENTEIMEKCKIIPLDAIPNKVDWNRKYKRLHSRSLNFLCLVSDYEKKGVDLILQAWFDFFDNSKNTKLYLACPNVPEIFHKKFKRYNIIHIKKAPLNQKEKVKLHSLCDISIAPLHTDGGANVIEAFENGLTVITMRSQRSERQNGNDNCKIINVPFYYYDPDGYGIKWKTQNEFYEIIKESKIKGMFNKVIEDFSNVFSDFYNDPQKVYDLCVKSYEYACGELSIWKRNAELVKIYNDILKEIKGIK